MKTFIVKPPSVVELIREGSSLLADILYSLQPWIVEGGNAAQLEAEAEKCIRSAGAIPAFKGYRGYPYTLCVSVNSEVVHGFPLREKVFKKGDLVSVDVGLIYKDLFTDTAFTFPVGAIPMEVQAFLKVSRQALNNAIQKAVVGNRISDISHIIQTTTENAGYSVVRELFGHGVGFALHEEPLIPNYGLPGRGLSIKPGMVLAIEVMVNQGGPEVKTLSDGWTLVTADGSLSAHYEHTVLVTEKGPEILTLSPLWSEG